MKFWQPTLFNRKVRTRSVSLFRFGKKATPARHVRLHSTPVRGTAWRMGGDPFDIKKAVAKRRGLL